MPNPNTPSHEMLSPQQGQLINFARPTHGSAELHMLNIGEMITAPDFRAGYNSRVDPRHPERIDDTAFMGQLADGTAVMGVLDGAGSYGGGDKASKAARQELHEQIIAGNLDVADRPAAIQNVMAKMAKRVDKDAEGNCTTATLAFIRPAQPDGSRIVDWAAVGDSPLYYYDADTKEVAEVTHEESHRQFILDTYDERVRLGNATELREDVVARADVVGNVNLNSLGRNGYTGLQQKGQFLLPPRAQLVIASDGIKGDHSGEMLDGGDSNERVISEVLGRSKNVKQKAMELVERARKTDDRMALVYENTAVETLSAEEKSPQPPEVKEKPTAIEEKYGVEKYNFRVVEKNRDGSSVTYDGGWKIKREGRARDRATGEIIPAIQLEIKAMRDPKTGEQLMKTVDVTVDEFMNWQKSRAEENKRREEERQARMGDAAREALRSAPTQSELQDPTLSSPRPYEIADLDAASMLKKEGFTPFQTVFIPKRDGSMQEGEVITARKGSDGSTRVLVSWPELDRNTNTLENKVRGISPAELHAAQQAAQKGGMLLQGRGQVVPTN